MIPTPELIACLHRQSPWEPRFKEALQGFTDPKKAWNLLSDLAGQVNFTGLFPGFFSSFLVRLAGSYNADMALANFHRFSEKISDKNYLYTLLTDSPDLAEALVALFSGSQVLTDTLLKTPSHIDWLKIPETLNRVKPKDRLMRDFHEMAKDRRLGPEAPALLRRFKKREYIRIGLRDLLGKVTMQQTVEDLSNLADVCLQAAYEYADAECNKKYGTPYYEDADGNWHKCEFAVLGMGKLGGCELNYSSDIDLIYIYTSSKGETRKDGEFPESQIGLSNHEYFTKLGVLLTKTIHEITSEGNVFRVDLNLRPEGQSGEIVNSLVSCEIYYQSWGRTWERQALIKARVSAGSQALGEEFFNMVEPFIYRRSLDFSAVEEIKAMKTKINLSLKGKKAANEDIKLGFGGIREVEFIVQGFQLLFGGRDKSLRVSNTLRAIRKLRELGFLAAEDAARLKEAYIFLRNLENRVQISFGLQTHHLPKDPSQLPVLARKMKISADTPEKLVAGLMEAFDVHRQFVGAMFAGLFVDEQKKAAAETTSRQWEQAQSSVKTLTPEHLEGIPFRDAKRAFRFLEMLRDGPQFSHPTEKSTKDFYNILPRLLDRCTELPDPNQAVENLVKFLEKSGARDSYLGLLASNVKFLELLLILFGSSDFLSDTLIRQPGLVDVLIDMESIYRFKPPEKIDEEFRRGLASAKTLEAKKIYLRRAKQGEELRIGVRYLIKEADLVGTLADLSHLAGVFLQVALDIACDELNKNSETPLPNDFAILGLGKLGASEINFGSDLDIVYVYEEPGEESLSLPEEEVLAHYIGLSQLIYQLASEMTPAGIGYKIDTDLRPEGSRGVLVHSVKTYETYFRDRARIWEQQAMTRARFVAGKPDLGARFLAVSQAFTYRKKLDYGSLIEISRLRERMEKELSKEETKGKNVKLGYGGLVDIEFTLQILQLMHGYKHPRLKSTSTLKVLGLLSDFGILSPDAADELRNNYLFLRNLECALRLLAQRFGNHLPKDTEDLAALARLLGYREASQEALAAKLQDDYKQTTDKVRAFYSRNLDNLLRTSL